MELIMADKFFGNNETVLTTTGPIRVYGVQLREVPLPPSGNDYNPPWAQWPLSATVPAFYTNAAFHDSEDRCIDSYVATQEATVENLGTVTVDSSFYGAAYFFTPDLPEFYILYQITVSLDSSSDNNTPPSEISIRGKNVSGELLFQHQIVMNQPYSGYSQLNIVSFDYVHQDSSKPIYLTFGVEQGNDRTYTFRGTWNIREIKRYPIKPPIEWTLTSKYIQDSARGIDPTIINYADYQTAYPDATAGNNYIDLPIELYYIK